VNAIRSYRDLKAWQKARGLVKNVYGVTRAFPQEEMFALTQQIRRAAISVPSTIAEGWGRGTRKEYLRFLQISRASLYELETQLLLAEDLGYLREGQARSLLEATSECSRILHGLISRLNEK